MSSNQKLYVTSLNDREMLTFGYEHDQSTWLQGGFPFSAATGNKNTAMVYLEVEPGHRLATHTDSAEEILVFLQGTAEVTVGDETGRVEAGDMALVPSMVPHGFRNVGDETLRVIGIFSSNTVMSTFEEPMVPIGQPPMSPLGRRTVLTPLPIELEAEPAIVAEAVV